MTKKHIKLKGINNVYGGEIKLSIILINIIRKTIININNNILISS